MHGLLLVTELHYPIFIFEKQLLLALELLKNL